MATHFYHCETCNLDFSRVIETFCKRTRCPYCHDSKNVKRVRQKVRCADGWIEKVVV